MNQLLTLRLLAALCATSLALWVAGCGSDVTETGNGGGGTTSTGTGGTGAAGGTGGGGTGGTLAGGGGGGPGGGGNAGAGGGAAVRCNPTGVVCAMPPPSCSPGEVASVEGGCWGPCVPILTCETEANCDNCQGAYCAEYTAWTTEYRCVLPTLQCSALTCSCLAPYFCPAPFDACTEGGPAGPIVSCSCPTC